jgi:uncharacterized protein YcaQ
MIKVSKLKDQTRLRRIALAAQGLLQSQPFGRGLSGTRKAIQHIGYVQIDTISVVERAHHHVLRSRVPNYQPDMLNQLLEKRDVFEYWSHAAAFLPIADFRFSLPYKQAIHNGQVHWYKNRDDKLMAELLARIHNDGPLRSRDLESPPKQQTGWWDWKPAKQAIEQLYMEGELMVTSREGFQKVYDLTERVLPSHIDTSTPSTEELAEHLIDQQLRCHGLVSLRGITYLRRNAPLRQAVKHIINERLAEGNIEQLVLDNDETFFISAGALEQPLPRLTKRLQILSPFDNSVIQRERLKSLFQFDYQIECYVPEAKRQYGYFSLPLLYGDQFIGRMDCKAHRKTRHFEIKSLHFEQHGFDENRVISAFADAVSEFLCFQQCDTVSMVNMYPTNLTQNLRRTLAAKF